jgi:class 3 adenylate cyclase
VVEWPETRYARSDDGIAIAYQVFGDGGRDLVLLRGGNTIDAVWDDPAFVDAMRQLGRWARVILLDYRGFGVSDPVPLGALPAPEDWADDLRVVLDAVGSERAHLVGRGVDGTMALLFGALHPERTATVAVVDATARVAYDRDYEFGARAADTEAFLAWIETVWGGTEFGAFEVPSRSREAEYLRWVARANRLTFSPGSAGAIFRWVAKLDIRAVLDAVRAPTLVLHSPRNPVVPLAHAQYLVDRIPDARLVVRAGQGDFLHSFVDRQDVLDNIEEFATGVRPIHDEDRKFAAILFTDFVDSTPKLATIGDTQWRALLDRHDQTVERELIRHRGTKVKWTGDGIIATFDGPARAVRCAVAIVDALSAVDIQVRAGLHAGEISTRGADIGGIAVHIAARVQTLANAGEVLVSRTIVDLVAGSGIDFEDRGEHQLKGVPGSWHLFAANA